MYNIFKVNGKINYKSLIINLLIPIAIGFIGSIYTMKYMNVYDSIKKSPLTPPSYVFPIVWTLLYILMGIAFYRVLSKKDSENVKCAAFFYFIQLLLNLLWTIIFFKYNLYRAAFIEILVLLFFIILTTIEFCKIDKTAAVLMIPYIIWVAFASFLTYRIFVLNTLLAMKCF